jgi:hypothetical protein
MRERHQTQSDRALSAGLVEIGTHSGAAFLCGGAIPQASCTIEVACHQKRHLARDRMPHYILWVVQRFPQVSVYMVLEFRMKSCLRCYII